MPFSLSGMHSLNSQGPHWTCNQWRSRQWQLLWGSPQTCLQGPLSLIFLLNQQQPRLGSLLSYCVSREPKQSTAQALSCCFLYSNPFLCFTVPSFNNNSTLKILKKKKLKENMIQELNYLSLIKIYVKEMCNLF